MLGEASRLPEGNMTPQHSGTIPVALIFHKSHPDINQQKTDERCDSRRKMQSCGFRASSSSSSLSHVTGLSYVSLIYVCEPWLSGLVLAGVFVPPIREGGREGRCSWREFSLVVRTVL